MPRIQCPVHPDCHIECPGSGYAHYEEPYGPCEAGCHSVAAGKALVEMVIGAREGAKFSGIVAGITSGVLAEFARDIAASAPPESSDDIAILQQLDILDDDRRITASWVRTDIAGIIHALAQAASGGEVPRVLGTA